MILFCTLALAVTAAPPAGEPASHANASSQAERRADASAASPDALEAARAFVASFDLQAHLGRTSNMMADSAVAGITAQLERNMGEPVPEEVQTRLRLAARQDATQLYGGLRPFLERLLIESYARRFTATELRHLTTVLADPLVRRMEEVGPELMRQVMERMVRENLGDEPAFPRLEREMRSLSSAGASAASGDPPG